MEPQEYSQFNDSLGLVGEQVQHYEAILKRDYSIDYKVYCTIEYANDYQLLTLQASPINKNLHTCGGGSKNMSFSEAFKNLNDNIRMWNEEY